MEEKSKILVVDDEESIRVTLKYFLEKEGFIVLTASNAKEALDLAKENIFLGAFVDRILPEGMDGLVVAKKLKEKQLSIQIVIMSAYPSFESAKEGIKIGIMDYIVKPIKKEDVILLAKEMVEKKDINEHAENEFCLIKRVLDALPVASIMATLDGSIIFKSQQFKSLIGDEKINHFNDIPFLQRCNWDDFYEAVETNLKSQPTYMRELKLKNKDDIDLDICVISIPYVSTGQGIETLIMFFQDISEVKKKEEELKLTQQYSTIGYLASGLVHNFNNIMQVVIGNLSLVKQYDMNKERSSERVERALMLSQKATEIVHQLQNLVTSKATKKFVCSLNDLLTSTFNLLRNLTTKQIEMTLNLPPQRCLSIVDKSEIEQVVINLVVNAQDAILEKLANTKCEGMTYGRITLSLETTEPKAELLEKWNLPKGKYHAIAVEDTGIGIMEEDKEKIFERFFTKKKVRKGTGIGLSFVKDVITAHKGAIEIESKPFEFTKFYIYLPVYESKGESYDQYNKAIY